MPTLFFRAHNRALSVASAFALVPVLLTGALTLAARPTLALQDAAADAKAGDKTYTIARAYTAKQTNRYKIEVNIKGNIPAAGGDVNIVTTLLQKETVQSVTPDGTATLLGEFESASVKFNELDQDMTSQMPTVTTTVDKTGHVLTTKIEGGGPQVTQGPGAQMLNGVTQPGLYPSKPVKIGDTWKIDAAKPKAGEKAPLSMTGTATLVGLETVDGVPTLKIKTVSDSQVSMDNPFNPGEKLDVKSHTTGVSNLEVASGKLIKAVATTESEGGIFGKKSTSEMSVVLLKDDGKDKPAKKDDKKADAK